MYTMTNGRDGLAEFAGTAIARTALVHAEIGAYKAPCTAGLHAGQEQFVVNRTALFFIGEECLADAPVACIK